MNDIEVFATSTDINALRKKNRMLTEKIVLLESIVAMIILVMVLGGFSLIATCSSQASTISKLEEKLNTVEQTVSDLSSEVTASVSSSTLFADTPEIYKCPICGWDAVLIPSEDGWSVQCTFCGETGDVCKELPDAIEKWNEKGGWCEKDHEILLGKTGTCIW